MWNCAVDYRRSANGWLRWLVVCSCAAGAARADDWPMWRHDARRSGVTGEELPSDLELLWSRQLPAPQPCWPPTEYRLQFDKSYEPVAAGGRLFVPSMVRDSVTAYDATTGAETWRFYADGPVRFAPVVWHDHVYVVSDDGYLYCLDADTGTVRWKVRGGPSDRKLLGNERLISMWPARGAPVVYEGVVYFCAGIWPFMGIFIHAVDAETGRILWTNSGSGAEYILQPHNSPSFAGVAPQGYLVVSGDRLLVSGGRSVPAVYDRKSGRFLYYRAATKLGNFAVSAIGNYFLNDGALYRLSDGSRVGAIGATLADDDALLGLDGKGRVTAIAPELKWVDFVDSRGAKRKRAVLRTLWSAPTEPRVQRLLMKAGRRLYGGGPGMLAAFRCPPVELERSSQKETPALEIVWQARIEGVPWSTLAADGRLFAVTEEGRLYCFGAARAGTTPRRVADPPVDRDAELTKRARFLVEATGVREGYAVVFGRGALAGELARQSRLRVIGINPESREIAGLRRQWDAEGLYGLRLAVMPGKPAAGPPLPPYMASLIVVDDVAPAEAADVRAIVRSLFDALRPYGGIACLPADLVSEERLRAAVRALGFTTAEVETSGEWRLLRRVGALPGSAPWTHGYGDAANSVCSRDRAVKPPLALLWFGGPSNQDVLPRHGHGPSEQVIGGRLFIEGIHVISARDVYTGRLLWRRELPELNTFDMYYNSTYNPDPRDRSYNQRHIPGANAFGANFVAAEDGVYLIQGPVCLVLDPADGHTVQELRLPWESEPGAVNWGHIAIEDDLLIAAAMPVHAADKEKGFLQNHRYGMSSRYLVGMDRHSGRLLWRREAVHAFRHNAIVAGNGRIYCIDARPGKRVAQGEDASPPAVLALEARTGRELWRVTEGVFGTWLGYSTERDILLEAGSRAPDRAPDEVGQGMTAYRGADGRRLWHHDERYSGPPVLHHDTIITQTGGGNTAAPPARAFRLLTGAPVTSLHPMTGERVSWSWVRFKGCNTAVASEHLLTFRSASGAFTALPTGHATVTIGGFKSGCTSNLIVADGVLNAPDYTRTCTCSYQNQSSLALVSMPVDAPDRPVVEEWSFSFWPAPAKPTPVKRVGINFGAPGDRMDDSGTLWIEAPSVGGPSPDLPVFVQPPSASLFRDHASAVTVDAEARQSGALAWVASSGIDGVARVLVRPFLQPGKPGSNSVVRAFDRHPGERQLLFQPYTASGSFAKPRPYTLRLHFAEPLDLSAGERVFDVLVQGREVLDDFDITQVAQGPHRAIVRELHGVLVSDDLQIDFAPQAGSSRAPLVCGFELRAEE